MSAESAEALARGLEAYLNEYVGDVVSVSYAVTEQHHLLLVYRPIEIAADAPAEAAVAVAEEIIDEAEESARS